MIPGPVLRCNPALLRPLLPVDAQAMFALAQDPQVSQYLNWDPPTSVRDVQIFIESCTSIAKPIRHFGILTAITREFCGVISFVELDVAAGHATLGTWLGVPHWGKGLNLAAKSIMFWYAFESLGLQQVLLTVKPENSRSIRAIAALPGIEYVRRDTAVISAKGRLWDQDIYHLTRQRWSEQPTYHQHISTEALCF